MRHALNTKFLTSSTGVIKPDKSCTQANTSTLRGLIRHKRTEYSQRHPSGLHPRIVWFALHPYTPLPRALNLLYAVYLNYSRTNLLQLFNIQDVSKMLGQTSRKSSSHQNNARYPHTNICPEISAFEFNWKITFKTRHFKYVIFYLQLT